LTWAWRPMWCGIDYARLVGNAHHSELGERVNYRALAEATGNAANSSDGQLPGQLDLLSDLNGTADLNGTGVAS
jgi:hypothetical protein